MGYTVFHLMSEHWDAFGADDNPQARYFLPSGAIKRNRNNYSTYDKWKVIVHFLATHPDIWGAFASIFNWNNVELLQRMGRIYPDMFLLVEECEYHTTAQELCNDIRITYPLKKPNLSEVDTLELIAFNRMVDTDLPDPLNKKTTTRLDLGLMNGWRHHEYENLDSDEYSYTPTASPKLCTPSHKKLPKKWTPPVSTRSNDPTSPSEESAIASPEDKKPAAPSYPYSNKTACAKKPSGIFRSSPTESEMKPPKKHNAKKMKRFVNPRLLQEPPKNKLSPIKKTSPIERQSLFAKKPNTIGWHSPKKPLAKEGSMSKENASIGSDKRAIFSPTHRIPRKRSDRKPSPSPIAPEKKTSAAAGGSAEKQMVLPDSPEVKTFWESGASQKWYNKRKAKFRSQPCSKKTKTADCGLKMTQNGSPICDPPSD